LKDYSVRSEFGKSLAVVTGTVAGERVTPEHKGRYEGMTYTLNLQDLFRGRVSPAFERFSENSSGRFPMIKGMEYLLFIYDYGDVLAVDNCGNSGLLTGRQKVTFPRFHRHLPKWENDEIGGQHEHEDTTVVFGNV
jgi:hypothetical protein